MKTEEEAKLSAGRLMYAISDLMNVVINEVIDQEGLTQEQILENAYDFIEKTLAVCRKEMYLTIDNSTDDGISD